VEGMQLALFEGFQQKLELESQPGDPGGSLEKSYIILWKEIGPGKFRKESISYYFVKPWGKMSADDLEAWLEKKNRDPRITIRWVGNQWGHNLEDAAQKLRWSKPDWRIEAREVI